MQFDSILVVAGEYQIKFVDEEEPKQVRVIAADILRWEQVNQGSFFSGEVGLSRITWVVWAAMRRTQQTGLEIAEFLRSVEDVSREATDEDDEDEDGAVLPDPTEEESDDSSPAWS